MSALGVTEFNQLWIKGFHLIQSKIKDLVRVNVGMKIRAYSQVLGITAFKGALAHYQNTCYRD
jgi:hypothetical protein